MIKRILILTIVTVLTVTRLSAQEVATDGLEIVRRDMDILWVLCASALVFLMQAGFLCVEAGFARAKNSINVAVKNVTDFLIAVVGFWIAGFALMFGMTGESEFFGCIDITCLVLCDC